jgi:hypothetical protein
MPTEIRIGDRGPVESDNMIVYFSFMDSLSHPSRHDSFVAAGASQAGGGSVWGSVSVAGGRGR